MAPDDDGNPKRTSRSVFVDITPLRASPAFAKLWTGTSIAQIGAQVTIVAVGLHVYALTESTLAVALVALWALGPMILAGFVGGALADTYDRRLVALVTAIIAWGSICVMALIAFLDVSVTWPYYVLAAVNAASATILGATRGAILPRLLSPQLLPAAAALSGITMGLAITVGPAVAGVLVASVGFPWTYLLDAVLFTGAFLGILSLPKMVPDGERKAAGFGSVVESMRFLRTAPNVRATFVWDLIAMILGTPRVVFPAAGALVLGGGPVTVGILTASFAIGALLSGLFSGPLGGVRRQGRAVTVAIAAFGACTALFGVVLLCTGIIAGPASPNEPLVPAIVLAGLALAGTGAADNVSAVFRTTILQTAAPDDVRGRMQGLFYVVVAGGPRIGDLLAGGIATLIALWAPPLFGGVLICVTMLILARTARGFMRYDAHAPTP
ncbi:MFS transporter [Leucobacter luti]|uniref:MFS transporter n=1 Tax=Leucobacter luti TaxID=340320 RepID=UPI001C68DE12|nr:MFS transporter [Leucobacter luti]QYM76519.1 MFS transporter [Leucobacter luti]